LLEIIDQDHTACWSLWSFPFGLIDLMYFHKSWPRASTFHHLKFNFLKHNPTYNGVLFKKDPTYFQYQLTSTSRCRIFLIVALEMAFTPSAPLHRHWWNASIKSSALGSDGFDEKNWKIQVLNMKKSNQLRMELYFSWWKILDSCLFISYICQCPPQFQIHWVLANFWRFVIFSVVSALSFRCMHWWDHKIFRASLISQRSVGGYEVCWFRGCILILIPPEIK